ncbi:MAG: Bcr/CflA family efflux MFS transporter [Pseudomonadota bacterium]
MHRTPPHFATLVALTGLSTLTLNMFLPSLAGIALTFDVPYSAAALAVSGYLGVTAVLQIIIGPLSDRFGRRPVLLVALALFAVASFGAAQAHSIEAFLGWRTLQGAVIAGGALSQAMVRDTSSREEAAGRLGYIAMAMAVVPMMGPVVGGVLDAAFGWRASFLLFGALGVGLLLVALWDVGETNTQRSGSFGAQMRAYPALLGASAFWGYALCTAFGTSAFYAFLTGVPLIAGPVLGLSPALLGVGLGSITAGYAFGSFWAGRLAGRWPVFRVMLLGRAVALVGLCLGLVLIGLGHVSVAGVFGATLCVGISNGLSLPGSNAGAMSVRPDLAGSAAGLNGALNVGTGAVVTSLVGVLVTHAPFAATLLSAMLACVVISTAGVLIARQGEARLSSGAASG